MKNTCFIFFTVLLLTGCTKKTGDWPVIQGETMGTYFSVIYQAEGNRVVRKRLKDQIENILKDINQTMSTYIDDSELSLLNQVSMQFPVVISEELFHVINSAQSISEITGGAFDVTIGPLVNLWGFGPVPGNTVQSENDISFVMEQVGYEKLILDETSATISKTKDMMYIDLSAIAKGYAVDRIAMHLDMLNINNYLVDIGGDLIGKGDNKNGQAWQIGIEKPDPYARNVQTMVSLDNMGMATSGDYRNYFEQDGVRYSHTLDPTTGKPVMHNLASVTVLHAQCMQADALATALLVMGADAGMALAEKLELPVYMIIKTDTGFEARHNSYFDEYLPD